MIKINAELNAEIQIRDALQWIVMFMIDIHVLIVFNVINEFLMTFVKQHWVCYEL